jgi:hypothetical protein
MLLRLFCLENKVEIRLDKIEWAVYPNRVGGLPAAFRTTLSPVFSLDYTKIERKKPTFSLPKPYFQPYFLNKTTLVARKASHLPKPY